MSSVLEKTSTASQDQGATGEEEVSQEKPSRADSKSGETPKKEMKKKKMQTLGKRTSLHRGEMPKKIKGTEGEVVMTCPTLRIGYKVQMPAKRITLDEYDAWFDAVECGNDRIKPLKLRKEEYREIMKECFVALDGGNVNVPNVPDVHDGVIDLEDYIKEIQEADKEWAMKYRIGYL